MDRGSASKSHFTYDRALVQAMLNDWQAYHSYPWIAVLRLLLRLALTG